MCWLEGTHYIGVSMALHGLVTEPESIFPNLQLIVDSSPVLDNYWISVDCRWWPWTLQGLSKVVHAVMTVLLFQGPTFLKFPSSKDPLPKSVLMAVGTYLVLYVMWRAHSSQIHMMALISSLAFVSRARCWCLFVVGLLCLSFCVCVSTGDNYDN